MSVPLPERAWKTLVSPHPNTESLIVVCYNILCDRHVRPQWFSHTSPSALSWDYRRKHILKELIDSNADVLCLQEVGAGQYHDYFVPHLAEEGYEGVYWPLSRYKRLEAKDRMGIDGCATFYKKSKCVSSS
jgi:CCR4-NOT transcription complex subunit 6